jgi:hypothetical protein
MKSHCKLNLTYGRFAKSAEKETSYLLFANKTTQFEHLMCETNWPDKIGSCSYKVDLPTKIPAAYSIVVKNVPYQWNIQPFEDELKKQYPTIVRAVRLFINGGRPLSKVRVDFASYKELSGILKTKRISMDEMNSVYAVEPYLPPTRVLRCYNCQAYDDHIAAHCPQKNDPICFRCAKHHQYNPDCINSIQCAHCNGEHMAGNPSCPVKLEMRQSVNQRLKPPKGRMIAQTQQPRNAWLTDPREHLFGNSATEANASAPPLPTYNNTQRTDDTSILSQISNTMLRISQQQDQLNMKMDAMNATLMEYSNEIHQIKKCVYDTLCPLLSELASAVHPRMKGPMKQTILQLSNNLTEFLKKSNILDFTMPTHKDKPSTQQANTSNSDLAPLIDEP